MFYFAHVLVLTTTTLVVNQNFRTKTKAESYVTPFPYFLALFLFCGSIIGVKVF